MIEFVHRGSRYQHRPHSSRAIAHRADRADRADGRWLASNERQTNRRLIHSPRLQLLRLVMMQTTTLGSDATPA